LHHQFDMTLEARISERTRIARELHDTLLQSFQGALLQFQSVANVFTTRPDEARERLERALDQAEMAILGDDAERATARSFRPDRHARARGHRAGTTPWPLRGRSRHGDRAASARGIAYRTPPRLWWLRVFERGDGL
jgi:hypothetical protein